MEEPLTLAERAVRLQKSLENASVAIDVLQAQQAAAERVRRVEKVVVLAITGFATILLVVLMIMAHQLNRAESRVTELRGHLQECRFNAKNNSRVECR